MEELKFITQKITFNFDENGIAQNKIDFKALEKNLEKGWQIIKEPAFVKNTGKEIIVTFRLKKPQTKVGFA